MNTVKAVVKKVLSDPYFKYDTWWVKVECNSYGRVSETELMFKSKQKAESVDIGYEFYT